MTTQTATARPAFRKPFTYGAAAYPEADTFAAALEGFRLRRKTVMFHMSNDGEAGDRKCIGCGGVLREPALAVNGTNYQAPAAQSADKFSTWDYSPKHKAVGNGRHYVCSWGLLFMRIFVAS